MNYLRAVLFDLDGTLINSVDHIVACWQHTVKEVLGREMSREEILPTLGRALLECFEEVAPGRSGEMREVYREYQKSTHDHTITLVEGTKETLQGLREMGLSLGVVTSKGIVVASEGLDLFGLQPFFDALVTYEDTDRHKPFPDPVLTGCKKLGVDPAEAIYVGDALFDIQAGKAAGTHTAAVTWGAGALEQLEEAGPGLVLSSMTELLTHFPQKVAS